MSLNINLNTIKELPWKDWSTLAIQLLADMRVSGSIAFFFVVVYFIGYDTVWRPNMEALSGSNEKLRLQQEQIQEKKKDQEKLQRWAKELEGLKTTLVPIDSTQIPSVVAAAQMTRIQAIVSGENRNASTVEPLPAPHDRIDSADVKQVASSDITFKSDDKDSDNKGEENPKKGRPGNVSPEGMPSADGPSSGGEKSTDIKVTRYDYEATVIGTFAALTDVINQLVLENQLIVIREISMQVKELSKDSLRPDPKTEESAPVQVEMKLKLSVYLAPVTKKPASSAS